MAPAGDHPTKLRILEAARRLFHEQGFNATGVATILREAEVNSGSLYHHFPSKDALLRGVLEYYVELLRPAIIEPAERATDDPIERVFAMLANYRAGLELSDFKLGCPIGNLALEVADDNSGAREAIDRNFRNWIAAVRSWLDTAGGRLPQRVDRGRLAGLVLTVMEGAMMRARAARSLEPFDESVAELRAYFDQLLHEARDAAGEPAAR